MRKPGPWLILIFTCVTCISYAQSSYIDSLQKFQTKYKKELYDIIKNDTAYVHFFSIDPTYKVIARVQKLSNQSFFRMPTSGTKVNDAIKYALLKFTLHGNAYELYAYQLSFLLNSKAGKNDFFVPFTDSSSGIDSYGGGRYIDFVTTDVSGPNTVILDFNKAYNPYCAFTTGYNCPVPPKENDLPVAIHAGEKNFGKAH